VSNSASLQIHVPGCTARCADGDVRDRARGRRVTGAARWGNAFSVAALVVIAIGFYWRLVYLRQISLFVDEFTTILAAQMIVERGVPLLPSGILYSNGPLASYVVAAFIRLVGFSEAVARFPSIPFSLLSVAVTFRMGKRLFAYTKAAPALALLASTVLALSPDAIMWGARARAYAQFQLWGLVGIWALAEGIRGRWRGRWRALFWLAMVGGALAHLAGVVLMLCSLAAALPAWVLWTRQSPSQVGGKAPPRSPPQGGKAPPRSPPQGGKAPPRSPPQGGKAPPRSPPLAGGKPPPGGRGTWISWAKGLVRSKWLDGLLVVILLMGMAALTVAGRPGWARPIAGPVSETNNVQLSALTHVSWIDLMGLVGPMVLVPGYVPWTIFLLVNLLFLLRRVITRRLCRLDAIPLYLHGVWMLTVLALTVVSPWHMPRYIVPLMPVFFLLGSLEMTNAARKLRCAGRPSTALGGHTGAVVRSAHFSALAGGPGWSRTLAGVIVVSCNLLLWTALRQVTTRQVCGYDLAFHYVQDHWREGDAVMSSSTTGSYVYLGQCDYYPIQFDISLLDTPAGPVDRATGASWIGSVDQLDGALDSSPRMWLVIDKDRFTERIYPELQRAMLARFEPVFEARTVRVFLHDNSDGAAKLPFAWEGVAKLPFAGDGAAKLPFAWDGDERLEVR